MQPALRAQRGGRNVTRCTATVYATKQISNQQLVISPGVRLMPHAACYLLSAVRRLCPYCVFDSHHVQIGVERKLGDDAVKLRLRRVALLLEIRLLLARRLQSRPRPGSARPQNAWPRRCLSAPSSCRGRAFSSSASVFWFSALPRSCDSDLPARPRHRWLAAAFTSSAGEYLLIVTRKSPLLNCASAIRIVSEMLARSRHVQIDRLVRLDGHAETIRRGRGLSSGFTIGDRVRSRPACMLYHHGARFIARHYSSCRWYLSLRLSFQPVTPSCTAI